MRRKLLMQGLPSAALAIAAVISGCGKARNAPAGTGDTATVGSAPASDTGMAAHTEQTPPAGGSLNDANIVALLDEANKADSAAGALAVTKATSPDVKAFARLMMSEHHALRLQGQQLAKKLGVTPSPPANDPLAPMAQQENSTLQSTPKGAEFDRAYIDQEVTVHKAVKDLLDQAKSSAQNDQLKDLITKAQPVIAKHLDQAESLQKKLTQNA